LSLGLWAERRDARPDCGTDPRSWRELFPEISTIEVRPVNSNFTCLSLEK